MTDNAAPLRLFQDADVTLRDAIMAVVQATRAYLPADGITAQECINRVLEAIDNPTINPIIQEIEND